MQLSWTYFINLAQQQYGPKKNSWVVLCTCTAQMSQMASVGIASAYLSISQRVIL